MASFLAPRLAIAGVAASLVTLLPAAALACGGMFCSNAPTSAPLPVDQSAERILFRVSDAGVTAHVHISYAGDPESFAWVVPVAGVPTVADSSVETIDAYDAASSTTAQLPQPAPCNLGGGGGGGIGCGAMAAGGSGSVAFAADASADEGGVSVLDHDFTDTYEFHIVGATDSDELFFWLEDNGYNVSDNMRPVMEEYLSDGTNFLALKLNAQTGAREVAPVAIGFGPGEPMIPIRLTAVAAQPLMGIQVFIVADTPYVPVNYTAIERDAAEIVAGFDTTQNLKNSYHAWVARQAAENGGRLFVREFAGEIDSPDPDRPAEYLTRYYTRLSPRHMTHDPMFAPAPAGIDLDTPAELDLSDQAPLTDCGIIEQNQPSECAFHYCGLGAACAETDDGRAMCVCVPGEVVQRFQGPQGMELTCVPASNPFAITDAAGGAGSEFDPCLETECGDGTCVLRGGFPTCLCDPGAAGVTEGGTLVCAPLPSDPALFGPGAGTEAHPQNVTMGGSTPLGHLLLLGIALVFVALRRRTSWA